MQAAGTLGMCSRPSQRQTVDAATHTHTIICDHSQLMMRSIFCASPGSLKDSRKMRSPASNDSPSKSNVCVNSSRTCAGRSAAQHTARHRAGAGQAVARSCSCVSRSLSEWFECGCRTLFVWRRPAGHIPTPHADVHQHTPASVNAREPWLAARCRPQSSYLCCADQP